MQVDRAFLEAHSSYDSRGAREQLLSVDLNGTRCFARLSVPRRSRKPGFVISHSIWRHFLTLRPVERVVSAALVGRGHPMLAIHRRGFGDSEGSQEEATLDRQAQDVQAAVSFLRAETAMAEVGVIGAGFGALLACLALPIEGVNRLVLIDPLLRGRRLFSTLSTRARIMSLSDPHLWAQQEDLVAVLRRSGSADVLGYPLHAHLLDSIGDVDLSKDFGPFEGRVLVVQVSRRRAPSPEVEAFRSRVEAGGGQCRVEVLSEHRGLPLGEGQFERTLDPDIRWDRQAPLRARIAQVVTTWMGS